MNYRRWSIQDPMSWAVSLVAQARSRHPSGMTPRERAVMRVSAVCFSIVAIAIAALLPSQRPADVLLSAGAVPGFTNSPPGPFRGGGDHRGAGGARLSP